MTTVRALPLLQTYHQDGNTDSAAFLASTSPGMPRLACSCCWWHLSVSCVPECSTPWAAWAVVGRRTRLWQTTWCARRDSIESRMTLTIWTEYGSVQCFCSLWLLRWYFYQQARCPMDARIWRDWILHLRHQLAGLRSRQRCRLQYLRWDMARYLCRSSVDRSRDHHDLLPD